MWVSVDLFFRAILEGLRENSVLTDVELNISNNEVSLAVQIWLKLVMLTDKKIFSFILPCNLKCQKFYFNSELMDFLHCSWLLLFGSFTLCEPESSTCAKKRHWFLREFSVVNNFRHSKRHRGLPVHKVLEYQGFHYFLFGFLTFWEGSESLENCVCVGVWCQVILVVQFKIMG